jgi:hypothetical protein
MTLKVTSDRQTLILAGETPPWRGLGVSGSQRVTIISARVDASMIVSKSDCAPGASVAVYDSLAETAPEVGTALPATLNTQLAPITGKGELVYTSSSWGASYNAASAYARTRDLSDRLPIIDTYA